MIPALRPEIIPEPVERFHSGYRWTLNPLLTLRDLLTHLGEELERYASTTSEWELEEHRINFYLFSCAIACLLDDYLGARRWDLRNLAERAGRLRQPLLATEAILNAPHKAVFRFAQTRSAEWREKFTACVDAACDLLLGREAFPFITLIREALNTAPVCLSETVLNRRMRIPEGFRCQDLAHDDVCSMVDGYMAARDETVTPILLLGLRTAGAYFAPLAAAYLRLSGHLDVSWITIRPKSGVSQRERKNLGQKLPNSSVLVIDDHPNSGSTLRLTLETLRRLGTKPEHISIAIPGHPARPDFAMPEETARGVRIFVLQPRRQYKAALLSSAWPERLLREYFSERGWQVEAVCENQRTRELNAKLADHLSDGFQVRLKRVFELKLRRDEETRELRVLAKSTGWGWLSYHAWIASTALAGRVPDALMVRNGFLFCEWIDGEPVELEGEDNIEIARTLGCYVAERSRALSLEQDPCFRSPECGWCGWDDLVSLLCRVYGRYWGRVKFAAVREQLHAYAAPQPAFIDGQMRPADWLRSGSALYKTDFEHHNFGGGELGVVDPAYDLAAAIFEFKFSPESEECLIRAYIENSGDRRVHERLLLYKLLHAASTIRAAKYWTTRGVPSDRRKYWNERYLQAWNFAAFHLARYCGSRFERQSVEWTPRLFFLDLDGVFDWNFLGFPHTTQDGICALQLLKRSRFSVVPNTTRSILHVLEYCQAYNLPGGVAECGSVFWDAVSGREISLIRPDSQAQLERLKEEVQKLPGVVIDSGHRYSVRAYRFAENGTQHLSEAEVQTLLELTHSDSLIYIQNPSDTYFLQKGTGKGPAISAVKSHAGLGGEFVAAMGDSDQDVDMLVSVDMAFAPANASEGVRDLISQRKCRSMSRGLQSGLLQAALELSDPADTKTHAVRSFDTSEYPVLMNAILRAPDRRPIAKLFANLYWARV